MMFVQWGNSSFINRLGVTITQFRRNYMHLKTSCLQNFDGNNRVQDIIMTDDDLMKVGEAEANKLVEKGFLQHILANKL